LANEKDGGVAIFAGEESEEKRALGSEDAYGVALTASAISSESNMAAKRKKPKTARWHHAARQYSQPGGASAYEKRHQAKAIMA